MKFLSSFDTKLKQNTIDEYITRYGKENIYVITRSKLYFYNKVILRILYGILLQLTILGVSYYLLGPSSLTIAFRSSTLLGLLLYGIALENYIDYSMNYAIFTPHEAILTEQIGLFNRVIKSLDISKIKTIAIHKKNLFYSVFNDGLLTIVSDGNDTLTEIIFKYVHNPEQAKKCIQHLIITHTKNK